MRKPKIARYDMGKFTLENLKESIRRYQAQPLPRATTIYTGVMGAAAINLQLDFALEQELGLTKLKKRQRIIRVLMGSEYDSCTYRFFAGVGLYGVVDEAGYIWKVENGKIAGEPMGKTFGIANLEKVLENPYRPKKPSRFVLWEQSLNQ